MIYLGLILLALICYPCNAGFITIDEFTNSLQSSDLGLRTTDGKVEYKDGYISMVAGVPESDTGVSLYYSFLPSPLVVKPKFVLTAKNNQTTFLETGLIRVSINGGVPIEQELFAAKTNYETLVFDFSTVETLVNELRVDYLRPPDTTGARELLIDSIVVSDVPEPPTFLLIAVCFSSVGIYKLHRIQTRRNKKLGNAKNIYRYRH